MIDNRIYVILTGILIISIISFVMIKKSEATSLNKGDIIYYISNDKIYKIVMPDNNHVEVIFVAPSDKAGEQNEIHWLTCGMNDTLLFNWTRTTGLVPDYSKADSKTVVVSYNILTKKSQTLIDLNETSTAFPALSPDGTQLAMNCWDKKHKGRYFIVKDLKKDTIKYYDKFTNINSALTSWSPDNKFLATSGSDEKNNTTRIFLLDIEKNELIPWAVGVFPIFSPSGKRVAYVSLDQRELIIADRDGNAVQKFKGYLFKDLNGWIGENKILFTIGHFMYQNHIGIADLETKKIYDIKVPTDGEINGICYKPEN